MFCNEPWTLEVALPVVGRLSIQFYIIPVISLYYYKLTNIYIYIVFGNVSASFISLSLIISYMINQIILENIHPLPYRSTPFSLNMVWKKCDSNCRLYYHLHSLISSASLERSTFWEEI